MSGSLAHSPAVIIQQMLIDLGHGTAVADAGTWPVYATKTPDSPDSAITVLDTVGRQDGREMITGERQEHPGIQIAIRDANHTDGWTKTNAIAQALDKSVNTKGVTVGTASYTIHAITRTSGPIPLGKETPTSARELFTINATISLRQSS